MYPRLVIAHLLYVRFGQFIPSGQAYSLRPLLRLKRFKNLQAMSVYDDLRLASFGCHPLATDTALLLASALPLIELKLNDV